MICADTQVDPPVPEHLPWGYVELEAGKKYTWRVEAFANILCGEKDPAPELIAMSENRTLTTEPDVFEKAKKANVSLHRAFTLIEGEEKDDPATFGFKAQTGGKPVFSTEFALQWQPREWSVARNADLYAGASVEARLHSSGEDKAKDAIKARISGELVVRHPGDPNEKYRLTVSDLLGSIKYETDHDADTKKLMVEVLYSPSVANLFGTELPGIDHYTGRYPPDTVATYMLLPSIGFDWGRTTKVGSSLENGDEVTRAVFRITGRVFLLRLAEALNVHKISMFADYHYRYLWHTTDKRDREYLESGGDIFLNDAVSIALRGAVGRDAPSFKFERSFGINLGVKF